MTIGQKKPEALLPILRKGARARPSAYPHGPQVRSSLTRQGGSGCAGVRGGSAGAQLQCGRNS